ncbi:MAG: homoserine dehydrogenase [Ruminococcaceae bacterium]|nr:homoserine dehydrogenase [Oscillospiraceae bacterium]
MGYGTVGSGVVEVFYKNYASIKRRTGAEMDIKYILDIRDFPGNEYESKFIKDFNIIESDPEVAIVVETIGGIGLAYDFVRRSLLAGKSVVTSNKELVAEKGAELLQIARDKGVMFLFEASVGGGIPIIHPLHQCLAANEIYGVEGILNGTTNYILTKMIREKMSFETALKQAQDLGYAERNPDADVLGHDACRKICILAAIAFGKHVYPKYVSTEGITSVTAEDVEYAAGFGGVIKLIGSTSRREDGRIEIEVSPAFVPSESQLSGVDDVFNGILVRGDATGDVVFYGKGAGKLPTASAVMADVIDAAKGSEGAKNMFWVDTGCDETVPHGEIEHRFYLRLAGAEAAKAAAAMEGAQVLYREKQPDEEAAVITAVVSYDALDALKAQLESSGVKVLANIRVLEN